jgi:glycerophosphoryl diester phosphodiesterase
MPPSTFDLQGHRGARGLRPENTLPSFEAAFDVGVTTVEFDLHLTADGVPVVSHDPVLSARLCRPLRGGAGAALTSPLLISRQALTFLRGYRADRNPDRRRFPEQSARVSPLAKLFAARRGIHPYTPPTLDDLFAFADAYAGDAGGSAGKTAWQRERARRVCFALELKRVPQRPEYIGDGYDGSGPGLLEQCVVEAVRRAGVLERTTVRSFDHRCVYHLKRLEGTMRTALLVAGTAPVDPVALVRAAGADLYCPAAGFLDRAQLRGLHDAGVRVVPWTVNEAEDWERLLDWGVDGITTDYPDRLATLLRGRGVSF